VNLARPHVTEPVLIIFVDTIFEADLTLASRTTADGVIWAKEVEDYQRFGVVVTDRDGYMTRIVEKPREPISKLANIGLYYIRDTAALWGGIDHVLRQPPNRGEFFLTDAFQWMIDRGRKILTAEVGGWYDCGTREAIIETNGILLRQGAARHPRFGEDVTLRQPVYIEDGVRIERSVIGPNVSVERGTTIIDSRLEQSLVGANCELSSVHLKHSLLGNHVHLRDAGGSASLGDHAEWVGVPE
jgi:glucose-1-phosphate thymidylyltransferase